MRDLYKKRQEDNNFDDYFAPVQDNVDAKLALK